jgi:hypothetical protein
MSRGKRHTDERMGLRARLEWLLVAAHSGRYGRAVHTGDKAFADDYAKATGAPLYTGDKRPRELIADLVELAERGHFERDVIVLHIDRARPYSSFTLTESGKDEALDILARTEQNENTTA